MKPSRTVGVGPGDPNRWLTFGILGAILLAAIALRFIDLASNPGGLFPDEAAEGLDARRILHEPGFFPVFLPSDGGREATFAWLVAAAFAVAGETVTVLRATAAALGVLGVLATWLLARRFGTIAGLAAAAWAAGSLWLVCVDRDGMRNALVPVCGALALLAILRWHERPGRVRAIVAGAVVAFASLYTYQPLKLLPVLLVAWIIVMRRVDRHWFDRLRADIGAFVGAFAAVALPMVIAAAADPANYFGRAAAVSPFNPDATGDADLIGHVLRTLGMFAVTGDANGRHDVGGLPLLGWPLSVVALVGLARVWRRRHEPEHALVLVALPLFLIPPIVATEGSSPHFLRALGLAAPLAVTIGIGTQAIVERVSEAFGPRAIAPVAIVLGAGFALLGIGSASAYFGRPVGDRAGPYSYDLVALAAAASRLGAVVVDDYGAMSVRFLAAPAPPVTIRPGVPIEAPSRFDRIVALRRQDLVDAVGAAVAARAIEVPARKPGFPAVWSVAP